MRNLFLIILLTGGLSACVSGKQETLREPDLSAWDYLVSEPAWACYGIITGLAIGFLWFRNKISGNKESVRRSGSKPAPGRLPQTQQPDKEQEYKLIRLEEALKKCRYTNEELKRELAEAIKFARTEVLQKIKSKPEKEDSPDYPEGMDQEPLPQSTNTIYYLQPSADGRFKERSKVHTAADALYELCYRNDNPNEATLKFIDSPGNTFLAIQNEPTWILVACERSNIPADHTQSVRTDEPGKAVWENGEWEIVQKAKITYT